jgi:hypothetical protein
MPVRDVVILSAARIPIGRYGGSFKDLHPAELGAVAARAAIERVGINPSDVDEVLIGHGRQAGSGLNPGRQVGHRAGIPHRAPAQTINKACASGLLPPLGVDFETALGALLNTPRHRKARPRTSRSRYGNGLGGCNVEPALSDEWRQRLRLAFYIALISAGLVFLMTWPESAATLGTIRFRCQMRYGRSLSSSYWPLSGMSVGVTSIHAGEAEPPVMFCQRDNYLTQCV